MIYGIPLDVRLSANSFVNPIAALMAPATGGLILGLDGVVAAEMAHIVCNRSYRSRTEKGQPVHMRQSRSKRPNLDLERLREAGSTQIGAGAASLLGRVFNLKRNDLRLMVGCGAAAAIAGRVQRSTHQHLLRLRADRRYLLGGQCGANSRCNCNARTRFVSLRVICCHSAII